MTEDELRQERQQIDDAEELTLLRESAAFQRVLDGLHQKAFKAFTSPNATAADQANVRGLTQGVNAVREAVDTAILVGEAAAAVRDLRVKAEEQAQAEQEQQDRRRGDRRTH